MNWLSICFSVVVAGSEVKLTPLVYGDTHAEGVPALAYCP
jgi:alpha-glucuronidase